MKRSYTIDTIFALLLFLIFTVSVLFVLINGAISYRNISLYSQSSFYDRTCISYIDAKIKHYNSTNNTISILDVDGIETLKINEVIDDTIYSTYIYLYEGMIKELFCEEDSGIDLEFGADVIPAYALDFDAVSPNLIRITCSIDEIRSSELFVNVKSLQEVL